jgi:hypothetical protein
VLQIEFLGENPDQFKARASSNRKLVLVDASYGLPMFHQSALSEGASMTGDIAKRQGH